MNGLQDQQIRGCLIKGKAKASKKVKKIWADMGYRGKQLKELMRTKGKDLETVLKPRRWYEGDLSSTFFYSSTQKIGS